MADCNLCYIVSNLQKINKAMDPNDFLFNLLSQSLSHFRGHVLEKDRSSDPRFRQPLCECCKPGSQ